MGKPARRWLALWLFCCAVNGAAAQDYAGMAHIVDGDTIEIGSVRIRFFGIDAPEGRQLCKDSAGQSYACGARATAQLRRLIGKHPVHCQDMGQAANNRRRGHCTANGTNLQRAMVAAGHAVAFLTHTNAYVDDERAAERARHGLWSGAFRRPADVRRCRDQPGGTIRGCSFE